MVAGGAPRLSCGDLEECFKLYHSLGLDVVKVDSKGDATKSPDGVRGLAASLNSTSRLLYLEFPSLSDYTLWLSKLGALEAKLRGTLAALKITPEGARVVVYTRVRGVWEVVRPKSYREGMLVPLPPSDLNNASYRHYSREWILAELEAEEWERAYKAYLDVLAPKPVEDAQARLEAFLATVPEQHRAKVREILERLTIDTRSFPQVLRLGASSVPMPRSLEDIAMAVELLLWRAGYGEVSGLYAYYVSRYLAEELRGSNGSELKVEVERVTEKEELAYRILVELMRRYTLKTFTTQTTGEPFNKNRRPPIYCFNGVVYEDCDEVLAKEIESLAEREWRIDAKVDTNLVTKVLVR